MKEYLSKLLILFLLINLSKEGTKKDITGIFKEYDGTMYSGYLDTLVEGNKLFYMYAPAQNDPDNAPLLLWLNGGPGCSSLFGFVAEVGPCITENFSGKWMKNPYSWNTNANLLAIEQPAGVGFSTTSDPSYDWTDPVTAKNLLAGIKDFLTTFPELKGRGFYVSGESYAGVYIPFLATAALEDTSEDKINLKGVLIGNGLTDFEVDVERSMAYFGYWHGLYSIELFKAFERNCYHLDDETNPQEKVNNLNEFKPRNVTKKCNEYRAKIRNSMYGNDMYGIYRECPQTSNKNDGFELNRKMSYRKTIFDRLRNYGKNKNINGDDKEEEDSIWPNGCDDDMTIDKFFNDKKNKEKLGVADSEATWTQCNGLNYEMSESISFYNETIKKYPNLQVWFFSGTEDGVLPTLGTMRWIKKLNLEIETEWRQWKTNKQISGYVERYTSGLTIVTIKGAGHMVPQDQKSFAFTMVSSFLKGELPPE